jgi:nicotinate-nucleotide adenylyltransferase
LSKNDYIGVFGGSFDPIHKGHIESLKSVTEKLSLSKVLVIPNKVSPLKDLSVASSLEKIKMLEIAFKDFKEIEIEDYELKKEGPAFMIETLQYLDKKLAKKKHFLLIIGEDSFQSFHRWKKYQHIIKMTSLLVMNRPGLKNDLTEKAIELHQDCIENTYGDNNFKKGKIYFIKIKPNPASSTLIRENIDDHSVLSEGLDDDVLKYLKEQKIYNKHD